MKYSIDEIFEMLSWNSSDKVQSMGIFEANKIKHISVLFRPNESKSTWENCAIVLASKTDDELAQYYVDLLEWLQDMNWPGAYIIYDRLKAVPMDMIRYAILFCLNRATQTNDFSWKSVLETFL